MIGAVDVAGGAGVCLVCVVAIEGVIWWGLSGFWVCAPLVGVGVCIGDVISSEVGVVGGRGDGGLMSDGMVVVEEDVAVWHCMGVCSSVMILYRPSWNVA